MKRIQKIFALVLALAMVFSLCACGAAAGSGTATVKSDKLGDIPVKAGFIFRLASHNLDYVYISYYASPGSYKRAYREDINYRFDLQYGLYGSIGVEYPLKKISLTCDLEYSYDYNKWTKFGTPERTVTKQNGICLSVGVKY